MRFRLQARDLPGTPDLILRQPPGCVKVFRCHGCFWHGHDCPMFKMPATRPEFWAAKISANRARDARARMMHSLMHGGWRVLTVWECALRGHWPQSRSPM